MTPMETLDAFRAFVVRQEPERGQESFEIRLSGYLDGFEYELLKSQQEADPRQLSLFD